MNDFQVLGSAISYLRRYCISSILGVVSDKDTDAGGEQIKVEAKKPAINESRFKKALQSIADGNYSVDELTNTFGLTDEQLKTLAL